jgi:hypothetical protein
VTRVEWTYTAETSRLLRALAVIGLGAIGGLFVFIAVGSVFVVGVSLLDGNVAILGLVLAFTLLFGRRLAGQAALFQTDVPTVTDVLPARELAAASVGWVVVAACLAALDVGGNAVYLFVVVVVTLSLSLSALLHTEGYVDTDEGVVVADRGAGSGSEATLAEVERVRRYDLGGIALLRVSYHEGTGSSARRLLTVPAGQADDVQRALVSSDADPPESDRNPLIAKTLYAFALGSFGVAAGFLYFATTESGDAVGIVSYVALIAALFGSIFAWLGYVEG